MRADGTDATVGAHDALHARLRAANHAYALAVRALVEEEARLARAAAEAERARAIRRVEAARQAARDAGAALAHAGLTYQQARAARG